MELRNARRAAVAAAATLALVGVVTAVGVGASQPAIADNAVEKVPLAQLAEEYPLQYDSLYQLKTKDWTGGYEGHAALALKMIAPVQHQGNTIVLDEEGDMSVKALEYDVETGRWYVPEGTEYATYLTRTDVKGCYSCKTSYYTEVTGGGHAVASEAIDEEFISEIGKQFFDCYLCHTTDLEAGADVTVPYSIELLGDALDELPDNVRVCAQCHQTTYHSPLYATGEDWDWYRPFDDGFDVDSVLARQAASGLGSVEASTGIVTYRTNHAEVEVFMSSTHASLGLGCTDCHMPTVVDPETGVAYTDHNASGSPLESEAALEYCLTCHSGQGIASTEEMAQMVRDLQTQTAADVDVVKGKLAELHQLIEDGVASGEVDEEILEQARTAYTTAKYYSEWGLNGNGCANVKVVHNPELIASLQVRATALLDEAIALF